MDGPRIRVLIAEDDASLRKALADFIEAESSLLLVGRASDAGEAVELATAHQPDVALVDVKMPGGGGPRAARGIRVGSPHTRVLALSAYEDRGTVVEMLRAGAAGYLVKGTPGEELVAAIHGALQGQGPLSAGVTGAVVQELTEQLRREEIHAQNRRHYDRLFRRMLAGERMTMAFQPIADLWSNRVVGMEALARFDAEADLPVDAWFSDAATFGLRMDLEMAAIESALWDVPSLPADTFLSMNLSPATAVTPRFVETVQRQPLQRVVIEVTEHARVEDYDALNAALKPLREQGLRLAVDDAGAGYASLQHIVRLAPDFVKLDLTLTRDIDRDPARRALATALVRFADEIGAGLIAEGIETQRELETLRGLGISLGQGFHIGHPQPLEMASFQNP